MSGPKWTHNFAYTSAPVSGHFHSLDWADDLIAFVTGHAVAIYDVTATKIIDLLVAHKEYVISVHWINSGSTYLVSASENRLIIWKHEDTKNQHYFSPLYICKDGLSQVKDSYSLHYGTENKDVFRSACVGSSSKVVLLENENPVAEIKTDHFQLHVKCLTDSSLFPSDIILVAFGGTDEVINLHTWNHQTNDVHPFHIIKVREDWIRSLDLVVNANRLLIASVGWDNVIRIWNINRFESDKESKTDELICTSFGSKFLITLETVLYGHEDCVTSLRWIASEPLQLLSASRDKSAIIWQEPTDTTDPLTESLWIEKSRIGTLGGGFESSITCAAPDSSFSRLVCSSLNGSLQLWVRDSGSERWDRKEIVSGHSKPISCIDWDRLGQYFITCSADQTCRLHAPINLEDGSPIWIEIARPQIHGYDLNCVAVVNGVTFVSGGEEKVVRAFQATKTFFESYRNLTGKDLSIANLSDLNKLAMFACVPALGLSNKAIQEGESLSSISGGDNATLSPLFKPQVLSCAPTEDILLQNTLWPEVHKLYGHGNQIFTVTASHSGSQVASACQATSSQFATVILWRTSDWTKCQELTVGGHKLTVTRIVYSPCDKYLLTTSRDRTWSLYSRNSVMNYDYVTSSSSVNKAVHGRIIWDASWVGSKGFITVSRDGKAASWLVNDSDDTNSVSVSHEGTLLLGNSINSVDCILKCKINESSIVGLGLEDGSIHLYSLSDNLKEWALLHTILNVHHLPIKMIRFRPQCEDDDISLATVGQDSIVRIIKMSSVQ